MFSDFHRLDAHLPQRRGGNAQSGWSGFLPERISGIEEVRHRPLVTIQHYDVPLYLEETFGGWKNRRLIELFDRYTETLFREYKGLVKYWLTFNEINCPIMIKDLLPGYPAQNIRKISSCCTTSMWPVPVP